MGTVYIEAMSSGDSSQTARVGEASNVVNRIVDEIRNRLPRVSDTKLKQVAEGDVHLLFSPVESMSVKTGDVYRIQGTMLLVQITEELLHVKIDGTRFFILLPAGGGGELQAKVGDATGVSAPVDALYYVGEATAYTTLIGTKQYAIPLLPLNGLVDDSRIKSMIDEEQRRRIAAEEAKLARLNAAKEAQLARIAEEAEARILPRLSHEFVDVSGKHRIDAAAIAFDGKVVSMIRLNDNKRIDVPITRLSQSDHDWLNEKGATIRLYGPQLERLRAHGAEHK
jgi:hypothetical protein